MNYDNKFLGRGDGDPRNQEQSFDTACLNGEIVELTEIGMKKVIDLARSYKMAREKVRERLCLPEGAEDTFFVGIYGSCVRKDKKPTLDSDIDGYLFYQTNEKASENLYLGYDLGQSFDSPAKSFFGHPRDRKPPNPNGKEDIEAHDITKLIENIEQSNPLRKTLSRNVIQNIAMIFSPYYIGDKNYVTQLRVKIVEAMKKRVGKPFDEEKWNRLRDLGMSEYQRRPENGFYGEYEDYQANGEITWKLIQGEYRELFQRELPDLEAM